MGNSVVSKYRDGQRLDERHISTGRCLSYEVLTVALEGHSYGYQVTGMHICSTVAALSTRNKDQHPADCFLNLYLQVLCFLVLIVLW